MAKNHIFGKKRRDFLFFFFFFNLIKALFLTILTKKCQKSDFLGQKLTFLALFGQKLLFFKISGLTPCNLKHGGGNCYAMRSQRINTHKGPFILRRNCVTLPHCILLHRSYDVTELHCGVA